MQPHKPKYLIIKANYSCPKSQGTPSTQKIKPLKAVEEKGPFMQPTPVLGQATEDKGNVNLQHSRLLPTSLVSLLFVSHASTLPAPSCWLGIAHQLPTLILFWHRLLQQLLDLSAASASLSGLIVLVFRGISQESTGNHSNTDCQKQQINFASLPRHPPNLGHLPMEQRVFTHG